MFRFDKIELTKWKGNNMIKKIGIVQINDTHANLFPTQEVLYGANGFEVNELGGYARIMTKVKEFRNKHNNNLLVFDNGDTFHGTYEAVESKGEVMLPYLNAIGINAMTFHWDSAYSPQHLLKLEEKLNYPILAVNAYHEGTKDLVFKPTEIYDVDGVRIGVIGIASNIIRSNMPKQFWIDTEFTDGIQETKEYVKQLKEEKVDLIVVLSHLGYPQDIELIKQVEGIDICLSGHTHNRIENLEKINDTYIIQSGSLGASIGYLDLKFDNSRLVSINHEFILLDQNVKEDSEILESLEKDEILNQYKEYLSAEVGTTKIDLHRGSSFYGTMDYFLNDAIRYVTQTDISFSNGWRYGGAIKAGKLTRRNLYQIVPMNPQIRLVDLSGQQLWEMLEENIENTFACEPFNQKGGYLKRNSGLKIYFKLENPNGHRLQKIFVGKEELDKEKIYTVAYITRQAVSEKYGENHRDFKMKSIQAMEEYLEFEDYHREDLNSYIPV